MIHKLKYIIVALGIYSLSVQAQGDNEAEMLTAQLITPASDVEMADVAYGTQAKEQLSISSFSISGEELLKSRASNILIALQGKLPGLNILQQDGEPGKESFTSSVRGYDSNVRNSVLFLVDGIERIPHGLDMNEVESVTVLRDAAATAIYGMRGFGGVVLITTKRGKSGESNIEISLDQSFQAPTTLPDFVSAYDYAMMYNLREDNDALSSGSMDTKFTDDELMYYRDGSNQEFYPTRDYVDDFMKEFSQLTRANINFSGGTDMMRYFTSVGFQHQGGLFENQPFEDYTYDAESKSTRINFRTNMDMTINDHLEAWVYIGGFLENANGPYVGKSLDMTDVINKLYNTPNGAFNDLTPDGDVLVSRNKLTYKTNTSVYGLLNRTGASKETETRIGNNFGLKQDLGMWVDGLSASTQVAFDVYSNKVQSRNRTYEAWETVADGDSLGYALVTGTSNSTLSSSATKFFNYMYNVQGALNYQHLFGKHYVNAMAMAERQMEQKQAYVPTNFLSFQGRANYAYDNRYLFEANMSYQGSEQFAAENRFGLFYSASGAWVLSNEGFLKDNDFISFLKLRASYGIVGNLPYDYAKDDQYNYLTTWTDNAVEDQIGNPDFSWEESKRTNLGIDAELFNSLTLSVDLFKHENEKLVITDVATIPNGYASLADAALPPANLGYGSNKGFEAYLAYSNTLSSGLYFSVGGNISYSKNILDYMAELPYETEGDDKYAYGYRKQGQIIGTTWGYLSDGLFNDQADIDNWATYNTGDLGTTPIPGDIRYKDITDDGIVDKKDMAPLGVMNKPNYSYGFNAQLAYKGFDLSIWFTGVGDRLVRLQGVGRYSSKDNFTEYMKNAWTAEDPTSDLHPRLDGQGTSSNYKTSDFWVVNGAFLRLKNVEIGYTLPESVSNKLKLGTTRFYVNALNPLVWHQLPNDDFDPEVANSDNTNYPIMKSANIGVNVKF